MATALYLTGGLNFVERKLDEAKFSLQQRPATGDVVLVEIDGRSLAELGIWPWPRRLHATVIERLLAAGASRVAFDVDFSAYSASADDARLAAALAASKGKVVLPVFRQKASNAAPASEYVDSLPALPFRDKAGLSNLNVFPSDDGRVRHLFADGVVDGATYPGLAALLAGPGALPHPSFEIDFGIDPATVPRLSYSDVISGRFDARRVAGKQVVIGSTAAELGDMLAVPYRATLPGPLVHILGYESIVQGRALQRGSETPVVALIILLVLGLGRLSERTSLDHALIAASVAALCVAASVCLIQANFPIVIDTVPLLLAILLTFVATMSNRLDQRSRRRHVRLCDGRA